MDVVVLGAGLTGLSVGHQLFKSSLRFTLLETAGRVGGQICSYQREGFVYERGPTTGIISCPEVLELFDDYPGLLQLASSEAQRRLIYKSGAFRPLPSGFWSGLTTPLFSWRDKLNLLREPWIPRGDNPEESVADLVRRRLGRSILEYAVDPFIGGIYAGDPERLVTRYALPKLYRLETEYGSFIRGTMALGRQKKTERERRVTKEIFSVLGGLSHLTEAIGQRLERIGSLVLGVTDVRVEQVPGAEAWQVSYTSDGIRHSIRTKAIVTTVSPQAFAQALRLSEDLSPMLAMRYAPVVQVAVGYRETPTPKFRVFGGLVPSTEDSQLLGILSPSSIFPRRAPDGGALFTVFLGGMRAPELVACTEEELGELAIAKLRHYLGISRRPDLLQVFKHPSAIPQYELSSGARFALIAQLEAKFHGLYIGGNMLGGIGMSDRIKQGFAIAQKVIQAFNG